MKECGGAENAGEGERRRIAQGTDGKEAIGRVQAALVVVWATRFR